MLRVITLVAALTFAVQAHAAECLRVAAPQGAGATGEFLFLSGRIFERAGFCLKPVRIPYNRIMAWVTENEIDGVIMARATDDVIPADLMEVPTVLAPFEGTLFYPPGLKVPSGPDVVLGGVAGVGWSMREALALGTQYLEASTNVQLFEMAEKGRLAGFMLPSQTVAHFSPAFPYLKDYQRRAVVSLHVVLLIKRRYGAMVPALNQAITVLKAEGVIEDVVKRYKDGERRDGDTYECWGGNDNECR